jgi:hypothetical protein
MNTRLTLTSTFSFGSTKVGAARVSEAIFSRSGGHLTGGRTGMAESATDTEIAITR